MSGIKFMGKDPSGLAKAISIDVHGNIGVQVKGNAPKELFSGAIASGAIAETEIINVNNQGVSIGFYSNSSNTAYQLKAVYYNTRGEQLDEEILFNNASEKTSDTTAPVTGILYFKPKYSRLRLVLTNNTGASRTYRLEYSPDVERELAMRKSPLRKTTFLYNATGVSAKSSIVIFDDFVLDENTTAWGLYFMEYGRSLENNIDHLKIRVEFTNSLVTDVNRYADLGGRLTYRQDFDLSILDEFNKALIVDSTNILDETPSTVRHSIILAGKYVNVPIGKLMRITLINTRPAELPMTFSVQGITLIEEGNY